MTAPSDRPTARADLAEAAAQLDRLKDGHRGR